MAHSNQKILLSFLPFWTPYIPPQGVTQLKSYLVKHGYDVITEDPNMYQRFRNIYDEYFRVLKQFIPSEMWGNFFNVGHDVMQNHMMVHANCNDKSKYIELVREIIYLTYYVKLKNDDIEKLYDLLEFYYKELEKYLIDTIKKHKPGIFGCSALSGTLPSCVFATRTIKKLFPEIITIVGGGVFSEQLALGTPNFENFKELTKDFIDKIFIGQGQILFLEWLKGDLPADKRIYTLKDINDQTVSIDSDVDVPDLSGLPVKDYLYQASIGSRSCPFNCSFCNVRKFWGEHKIKNVKQTANEMIMQSIEYSTQLFFMYDSLLNTIIDDLSEELYKSEYAPYFVGYLRVCAASMDIKRTLKWRRGGFYRARIGLESASGKVLKMMNKDISPELMRGSLIALAYAGIKTTGYFVIGHPGETEEDFQMTMDFVEEYKNYFWEVECNPFNYYFSQNNIGDQWNSKRRLLYPEEATEWLISQTWTLDIEPKREEVYERMNRFVQHCDKLGIPNPYNIQEINDADMRWKRLHKNAVPAITELRDHNQYINECKYISEIKEATEAISFENDFIL